jgi:hypothetical protein
MWHLRRIGQGFKESWIHEHSLRALDIKGQPLLCQSNHQAIQLPFSIILQVHSSASPSTPLPTFQSAPLLSQHVPTTFHREGRRPFHERRRRGNLNHDAGQLPPFFLICNVMPERSKTNFDRFLVVAAQPAWSEGILCGSYQANAAHNVALQ